ncbi:Ubiquinone biosynthesis O-methyltransferase [uncultured archaeon]|nr:Ubiquinone biosynthesis O-methyltransferase [uncultured archaeon]
MQKVFAYRERNATAKEKNPYSDRTQIRPLIEKLRSFDAVQCSEHEFKVFTRELGGKTVLDAGCGPGVHLENFKKNKFRAIGIDSSAPMVEEASKTGCRVERMRLQRLRFKDSTFHGVWCNAVLHHLDQNDVQYVLKEFRRVLKTNGLLFVSMKSVPRKRMDNVGREFYPMTKERLEDLAKKAGFCLMRIYDRTDWIEMFAHKLSDASLPDRR